MRLGRSHAGGDRGAVAVEFAIVLPVLLLLVFGIIDFGRALNAQVTLTQAAREGSRLEALDQDDVESRTQAAATGLDPVPNVAISSSCPDNDDAVVTVTYTFEFATPVGAIGAIFGGGGYGDPITLTSEGVMPCEG